MLFSSLLYTVHQSPLLFAFPRRILYVFYLQLCDKSLDVCSRNEYVLIVSYFFRVSTLTNVSGLNCRPQVWHGCKRTRRVGYAIKHQPKLYNENFRHVFSFSPVRSSSISAFFFQMKLIDVNDFCYDMLVYEVKMKWSTKNSSMATTTSKWQNRSKLMSAVFIVRRERRKKEQNGAN